MSYLGPRLALLRPGNALMAAIGVVVGIVLVARPDPIVWVGASLAAFLVTGFGNVLNDVLDRDLDRTAHPERPLPAGTIGTQDATRFAVLLLLFGLFEAYLAGGLVLLGFAAGVAATLVVYETQLKRRVLVGNLVVALLVGATFVFGAVAAGTPDRVVWILATLAALTNLAREVWKDLQDRDADAATRRTLAHVSVGASHVVAVASIVAAVAGTVWLWPHLAWPAPALWLLALADVAFVAALIGVRRPGVGQQILKGAMWIALAAFLVGASISP